MLIGWNRIAPVTQFSDIRVNPLRMKRVHSHFQRVVRSRASLTSA